MTYNVFGWTLSLTQLQLQSDNVCYCRENWETSTVLLLMRTFFSVRKKEASQSRDCLDWLLQLMGLIKNFVTGRESVNSDRLSEVYYFNTFIYISVNLALPLCILFPFVIYV